MIYLYCFPLDQAEMFKKYLSSKHPDLNVSLEKQNDGCLSILDVNIFREKGKFVTNVYRENTFGGVYTNFDIFIPETYKTGLIKSLLFRCFNLCSDFVKFHQEINILKSIMYKNSNAESINAENSGMYRASLQIRTRINRVMENKLPYYSFQIVFQTKYKLINVFTFKDKILVFLRSGIVYNFKVRYLLPIMANLSVILISECVNTLEFCSYWKESERG